MIVNMNCRCLSTELASARDAARDFEDRLRLNLETSMKTEEENEIKVKEMTDRIALLGRGEQRKP